MVVRLIEKLLTFLFDIVAVNIAFAAAFWLRYKSGLFPEALDAAKDLASYFGPMSVFTVAWIILFFLTGLYRDWYKESRIDEFFVVTRTVITGIFLLFLVTSAEQIMEFAATGNAGLLFTRTKLGVLGTYGACMLVFATINRFGMHTLLAWLFAKGLGVTKVLIVGADPESLRLVHEIQRHPELGNKVAGFVDDDGRKKGTTVEGFPVFGTYSELAAIIKREYIAGLIISHVSTSAAEIERIITYSADLRVTIYMVPSLMDVISGHLKTHQLFGVPLMVLLQDHMPAWEAQIKRLMDIVVSALVLVLGAPVWLALIALVRLTSPGPAIYKQIRAGQYGRTFTFYKFRSMVVDAEKHSGPKWATENDPRVTPIGRILRKARLDEIPQFYSVLKGEMSLVGPRPERPFFIEELKKEIPWYVRRLKMKPGITGWAQVKHKYDATIDDVKQKVIYDLYYFENMSIVLDLKIMLRTVLVMLTGKGAH